ncbi:hypothetical protein EB118_12520, partial [bacterium]|nr:hypothetical protein [bacterium]
ANANDCIDWGGSGYGCDDSNERRRFRFQSSYNQNGWEAIIEAKNEPVTLATDLFNKYYNELMNKQT